MRIFNGKNFAPGSSTMKKFLKYSLSTLAVALTCLFSNIKVATASEFTLFGSNPTWGWAEAAQSFSVPTTENVLSRWTFYLGGSGTNYKFSIVGMDGGAPDVTQPLFSVTNPWGVGAQEITGINLALTPGSQYAAVIDFLGYTDVSVFYGGDGYSDGNGFWGDISGANSWTSFPDLDLAFSVEFVSGASVPEPASIALFGLGLAGILVARRRKAS